MEEREQISLTVVIAGRPYPIRIQPADEEALRKIVKEINEKVNKFQLTYTKKDKQDWLSMALLTYAVELHKTRQTDPPNSTSPHSEQLDRISALLDNLLGQ